MKHEAMCEWRILHSEELHDLHISLSVVCVVYLKLLVGGTEIYGYLRIREVYVLEKRVGITQWHSSGLWAG
jgi:hypothetical protein